MWDARRTCTLTFRLRAMTQLCTCENHKEKQTNKQTVKPRESHWAEESQPHSTHSWNGSCSVFLKSSNETEAMASKTTSTPHLLILISNPCVDFPVTQHWRMTSSGYLKGLGLSVKIILILMLGPGSSLLRRGSLGRRAPLPNLRAINPMERSLCGGESPGSIMCAIDLLVHLCPMPRLQ